MFRQHSLNYVSLLKVSKVPQYVHITIHYCGHTEWIESLNKAANLATIYGDYFFHCSWKFETCHHPILLLSNMCILIHSRYKPKFVNKILRTKIPWMAVCTIIIYVAMVLGYLVLKRTSLKVLMNRKK